MRAILKRENSVAERKNERRQQIPYSRYTMRKASRFTLSAYNHAQKSIEF